jgi:hypothetical protein
MAARLGAFEVISGRCDRLRKGWQAVSFQDFVGHVWSRSGVDRRRGDRLPDHQMAFHRETPKAAPDTGRHPLPSGRLRASRRARMPHRVFVAIACCWIAAVAALLGAALAIRWFG